MSPGRPGSPAGTHRAEGLEGATPHLRGREQETDSRSSPNIYIYKIINETTPSFFKIYIKNARSEDRLGRTEPAELPPTPRGTRHLHPLVPPTGSGAAACPLTPAWDGAGSTGGGRMLRGGFASPPPPQEQSGEPSHTCHGRLRGDPSPLSPAPRPRDSGPATGKDRGVARADGPSETLGRP